MTHSELTSLIHAVLDGEATSVERRQLEAELAADPAVRAEFESLRTLSAQLRALPAQEPPEGLVATVLARLPDSTARTADQPFADPRVFGPTTIEPTRRPQGAATRSLPMSVEKKNVPSRRLWIGGGVALAALVVAVQTQFPRPAAEDTAGTIAPAQRYRAPDNGSAEVKLAPATTTATPTSSTPDVQAAQTADARSADARAADARAAEARVVDAKAADLRLQKAAADAKSVDARVVEAKAADAKAADLRVQKAAADAKSVDARVVEAKAVDAKAADAKAADLRVQKAAADAKSVDARVVEAKAADAKAADLRAQKAAADAKAADARAVEAKSVDAKAADARVQKTTADRATTQ
jgi:hypothetical protein